MKSSLFSLALVVCALLLIQGCKDNSTSTEPTFNNPPPYSLENPDSTFTTEDGLKVYILESGYGSFTVIPRDQVAVKYTGYTTDLKVFDSTFRNDVESRVIYNLYSIPIDGPTGTTAPLVEGFRRGILGMKEGEKRTIIVPPSLGYGEAQPRTNGFNLRNDTLRFDIELVNIF